MYQMLFSHDWLPSFMLISLLQCLDSFLEELVFCVACKNLPTFKKSVQIHLPCLWGVYKSLVNWSIIIIMGDQLYFSATSIMLRQIKLFNVRSFKALMPYSINLNISKEHVLKAISAIRKGHTQTAWHQYNIWSYKKIMLQIPTMPFFKDVTSNTTQSSNDTPQNILDKIDTTKETEENITL